MNATLKRTRPAGTGRQFGKALSTRTTLYGTGPRLRLPPYGREVEAALAADEHPNVRLYACHGAWGLARSHRYTHGPATVLVLPPGDDPEAYRWPSVRELVAIITGLDGALLQRLARALVRDGCRLAYLLDVAIPERNLRVVAKQYMP